jgi:hypothetical protein
MIRFSSDSLGIHRIQTNPTATRQKRALAFSKMRVSKSIIAEMRTYTILKSESEQKQQKDDIVSVLFTFLALLIVCVDELDPAQTDHMEEDHLSRVKAAEEDVWLV